MNRLWYKLAQVVQSTRHRDEMVNFGVRRSKVKFTRGRSYTGSLGHHYEHLRSNWFSSYNEHTMLQREICYTCS